MPTAALSLDPVFGSHMVLQRDQPIIFSGRAAPGAAVSVRLHNHLANSSASDQGRFRILLPAMASGGSYAVVITSGDERLVLDDVVLGDVWLCSGQSNMELRMATVASRYAAEISQATDPRIRLFTVPNRKSLVPLDELPDGSWKRLSPQAVNDFSAVAYFFGRDLASSQDVPIGLICSAWGGTIIETWIDATGLQEVSEYSGKVHPLPGVREANRRFREVMAAWRQWLDRNDPGVRDGYATTACDDSAWKQVRLPQSHAGTELADVVGTVWYRYHLVIPMGWAGRAINLYLAAIDGYDEVYLNGTLVRQTDATTTHPENLYRCYTGIPASLVTPGVDNVIAVRVFDTGAGPGGICLRFPWCTVQIEPEGHTAQEVLFINDGWRYHVGFDGRASDDWHARLALSSTSETPTLPLFQEPPDEESANFPSLLCNAMIMPLTPLAITGVIWYQGEANTGNADLYRQLLPALFRSWRALWRAPQLPFLVVQLANFREQKRDFQEPVESDWAHLRDAQLSAMSDPRTGLAVAIDLGDADDIHPLNKLDVGLRLARQARHLVYGEDQLVPSGPLYHQHELLPDGRMRIAFTHAEGLKTTDGKPVRQLAVAGADGRFVWGVGNISEHHLVVAHPQGHPVAAVRYAWANHPPGLNLVNGAGLPASPFRTDTRAQRASN